MLDVLTARCSNVNGKTICLHVDDMLDLMMACLLAGDRTTAWHCASGCLPLDKNNDKIVGTMEDLL